MNIDVGDPPPEPRRAASTDNSPAPERSLRPGSRPATATSSASSPATASSGGGGFGGDGGNLFYAYARKSTDHKSRYLLTFASARIATEWHRLLRAQFPPADASRPSPQLFVFENDDLLAKAWKHPAFRHLKSKWMYVNLGNEAAIAAGAGTGSVMIPVQDADGNVLGGGAAGGEGSAPSSSAGSAHTSPRADVARDLRSIRGDFARSANYPAGFATMDVTNNAVEKNGRQAAMMSSVTLQHDRLHARTQSEDNEGFRNGSIPTLSRSQYSMDSLSGQFDRMNELLSKHADHVAELTRRQVESEDTLRRTVESIGTKQQEDRVDIKQLSQHLDRIQSMMEKDASERGNAQKQAGKRQGLSTSSIDLSPLADRLENVQKAVEQNSALLKSLLDGRSSLTNIDAAEETNGERVRHTPNFASIESHFEKMSKLIAQQTSHLQALSGLEDAGSHKPDSSGAETNSKPDAYHPVPLSQRLERIQNAVEESNEHARAQEEDIGDMSRHFAAMRATAEEQNANIQQMLRTRQRSNHNQHHGADHASMSQLETRLESLRIHSEKNVEHMRELIEAVQANGGELDFTPIADLLENVRDATEKNSEHLQSFLDAQQQRLEQTPPSTERGATWDITPLTDRLNRIHAALERSFPSPSGELERRDPGSGTGDVKFIINALTSHLSKIQAVTEQNAQAVKSLRETTQGARVGTSSKSSDFERGLQVQNAQMRELLSGQREMVEVVRELAKSFVARNPASCGHVIVPPPRKTDRKVVGFVYDTKEEAR